MSNRIVCFECFHKQQTIDLLQQENKIFKSNIHQQERTIQSLTKRIEELEEKTRRSITEGPFGSSTPSSKIPIKTNVSNTQKKNGARRGHPGNGRKKIAEHQADHVETIDVAQSTCPDCNGPLKTLSVKKRTVNEVVPVKVEKILYLLQRKHCPVCQKFFQAKARGVLPKSLYGNGLLSHVAYEHYGKGLPLHYLEKQLRVSSGALMQGMHRLGVLLETVTEKLVEEYRQAHVKHADETSWRMNGQNWYVWLFCTMSLSIFRFRNTRSASVAKEIFGEQQLPGTLCVDRYAVYNKCACFIQYCYAHLLRLVKDLLKEFNQSEEVCAFVEKAAPLLAMAMRLRTLPISDTEFYLQASQIKQAIIDVMNQQATHAGIWSVQQIFREHNDRLYHWARDRDIPAHNNQAERDLRGSVIARKISFQSRSSKGAHTREVLMSIIQTLEKRFPGQARARLKDALDRYVQNPSLDLFEALFA